jgi:hypothetical protein
MTKRLQRYQIGTTTQTLIREKFPRPCDHPASGQDASELDNGRERARGQPKPKADEPDKSPTWRYADKQPGIGGHPLRQISSVALVVLHPPVGESLHPEWIREMHPGVGVLEHADGPVPAVGDFQDHLGMLAGLRDLRRQDEGIVVEGPPSK